MEAATAPDDTPAAPPLLTVHFGDPAWQAHLGGDFHAPEESGGMSWIWMGAGRCWVILPGGLPDSDLQMRLEAAPHWPVPPDHDIMDISVVDDSSNVIRGLACRPKDDAIWQALPHTIPFRGSEPATGHPCDMMLRVQKRAPLTLEIRADSAGLATSDSAGLATMEFDQSQLIQAREFLLPRGALNPSRTLTFKASSAIAPVELAPGHPDARRLSFRLFRMQVRAAQRGAATT
jgi:hypothetical protein